MPVERVLIVGHGSIGQRHLRLARKLLPGADIRVLRHRGSATVPQHANGCFAALDDAIAFAPQIAVIANPSPYHLATAMPLARAGVHLLVEKPLAASPDGVAQLLEDAQKHGVILLIGYNLRYLPSLQEFRRRLGENAIGRVFSVRCEIGQYLPSWRADRDYRETVSARKKLGGGVLLELSHELDYLRWIFGDVEWVTASVSRQSTLDIDVEDSAHLILGFKSSGNGYQLVGTVNMDFIRLDSTRMCTAIGEAGSLRWNGLTGTIEQYRPGANKWTEVFCHQGERDDSYCAEWRHLLSCVDKREMPLVSGEDGAAVLNIVEAARRSAAGNCRTLV